MFELSYIKKNFIIPEFATFLTYFNNNSKWNTVTETPQHNLRSLVLETTEKSMIMITYRPIRPDFWVKSFPKLSPILWNCFCPTVCIVTSWHSASWASRWSISGHVKRRSIIGESSSHLSVSATLPDGAPLSFPFTLSRAQSMDYIC